MKTNDTMKANKTNSADNCKFCGSFVNLDDEGVTYANGTCAHDHCDDSHNFQTANSGDFQN